MVDQRTGTRQAERCSFIVALSFVLLLCGAARGQGLDHQTAAMSSQRVRPAVTFVGDKLLVIDGYDDWFSGRATQVVDVYDVNTWALTGTMTTPHATSAPRAVVIGTKVLVATGGWVDIYDDSTGLWSSAPLSEGRHWMGAAAAGGKAFFAGGGNQGSTTVDVYDDPTGSWTTDTLSVGRTGLAGTAVGTKVLFGGGYVGDVGRKRSSVVDIFDTATGQWTTAQLSQARSHLAAVTVGDLAFFAGGSYVDGDDTIGSDVVDIYDATTGQWSVTHMPHARTVLAAGAVGSKALFAGGGYRVGVDYVDIYDTRTGQWSSTTLSEARGWAGGATDGETAVFAGGIKAPYDLSDAVDIFTPEPATLSLLALGGPAMVMRRRRT